MRLAIIADIHGNLPAFEAVLADIKTAVVDSIICLGDIANLGPFPSECIDLLQAVDCEVVLQGNHELYLLGQHLPDDWPHCPTWDQLRWTQARLRPEQFEYIANLPFSHSCNSSSMPAKFVHGSPLSQFRGFHAGLTDAEVAEYMHGDDNLTLFCGHVHRQLLRRWSATQIVNVGSVGIPLEGDPYARYAIVTQRRTFWHIEFRTIAYNVEAMDQAFDRSGMQAAGGMITAAFRHQIRSGTELGFRYIIGMRRYATAQNITTAQAYQEYPVPAEIAAILKEST